MRLIGFAAVLLLVTSGCGFALTSEGVVKGVDLPEDLGDRLHSGMKEADIVDLLGAPPSRRARGAFVSLRYSEVYQHRGCVPFFLFIPLGATAKTKTRLMASLENDGLIEAWLEVREKGTTTKAWLVGKPAPDVNEAAPSNNGMQPDAERYAVDQ